MKAMCFGSCGDRLADWDDEDGDVDGEDDVALFCSSFWIDWWFC